MEKMEFNLLDESWIRVLLPDCTVQEISLTQVFVHAQEYVDLSGELPTQDVAVLRLLLAVLHTVFSRVDENGRPAPIATPQQALERWSTLWKRGRLPEKPIRDYLERYRDRFWLFHPEYPFYQVPQAQAGTEYGAAKLNGELSESSNKRRMFTQFSGIGKEKLTYAQAARWLLYLNGYDDTSAKPKGKGLPSPGAGWLGKLGLILVQGNNLFETLLLNLTLLTDDGNLWQENHPCWELDKPRSAERIQIAVPDNPAQLLTLQSRRLLLRREEGNVIGFSLLGGDFFERENAFSEQMTVWRNAQTQKNGPALYVPQRHDPAKQFWREFPAVFVSEGDHFVHRPGIVGWVTILQHKKCLPKKQIRFRSVAVKYGDKDFFITDTFSDTLTFHSQLLDDLGRAWRNRISGEIGRCDKLAVQVGFLAKSLAIAAGDDEQGNQIEGKMQNARGNFYFEIDAPFRFWLASIDPETDDLDDRVGLWQQKAQQIAWELGNRMVAQAGTSAIVGRTVTKTGKGKNAPEEHVHYSAPEAFNRFLYMVKKIYEE